MTKIFLINLSERHTVIHNEAGSRLWYNGKEMQKIYK